MDAKQIVAIIAVIAVAAAGIGAAYAYQATLVNESNTVESNFLALDTSGDFEDTFEPASAIKYDSKTVKSSSTTAFDNDVIYTPWKTDGSKTATETVTFWDGDETVTAKGIKVNATESDPYVIQINSSMMEEGNFYTFALATYAHGTTTKVDLQKAYVIQWTYQSGQDDEVSDAMLLANEDQYKLFVSDVSAQDKKVSLTLWAIEFTGKVASIAPGYEDVDFQFMAYVPAEPVTQASMGTLTVTTVDYLDAALEVDTVMVYNDDDSRIILDQPQHIPGSNSYAYSVPADTYKAQAARDGGYAFGYEDAVTIAAGESGDIELKETYTDIAITTQANLNLPASATTLPEAFVTKLEVTFHGQVIEQNLSSLERGATFVDDSDTSVNWGLPGVYAVKFTYTEDGESMDKVIKVTICKPTSLAVTHTLTTSSGPSDWTAANVIVKVTYGAAGEVDENVFAHCTDNHELVLAVQDGKYTAQTANVQFVYTCTVGDNMTKLTESESITISA